MPSFIHSLLLLWKYSDGDDDDEGIIYYYLLLFCKSDKPSIIIIIYLLLLLLEVPYYEMVTGHSGTPPSTLTLERDGQPIRSTVLVDPVHPGWLAVAPNTRRSWTYSPMPMCPNVAYVPPAATRAVAVAVAS